MRPARDSEILGDEKDVRRGCRRSLDSLALPLDRRESSVFRHGVADLVMIIRGVCRVRRCIPLQHGTDCPGPDYVDVPYHARLGRLPLDRVET